MQGDPNMIGWTRDEVARLQAEGRAVRVVDVRTADEYAQGTALEAAHVPADRVVAELRALDPTTVVVTVCNHGGSRSQGAAVQLREAGLPLARHLVGGVRGS